MAGKETFIRSKISKQRYAAEVRRAIPWTVNEDRLVEKILADPYCQITGEPLQFEPNYVYTFSIDRKDSDKGYTDSNVQWVGVSANMAKNVLTDQQFLDLCLSVVRHNGYEVRRPQGLAKIVNRLSRRQR